MTKKIASRDNATFKQLKKLAESARERRKAGQALLDGVHLVEAALQAGVVPNLLAMSDSGAAQGEIAGLLQKLPGVQAIALADGLFAEISPVETPAGILALIEIPHPRAPVKPTFALLLEDVQDPGNLGTLLRSAAAAGVEVAWLSQGCADAWSPKVLRAGMGAHFALVIEERANLLDKTAGFAGLTVATSLAATHSLYELDLTGPVAVLAGNEGAGLSAELQAAANTQIRIPMPGRMESLNVAAATSICLFERVRQCTSMVL
ncbi:MAG TPA: RNA methyltransferase [Gallionella sp.]|nr:RNA methyltransferase [Gallionella sp.]